MALAAIGLLVVLLVIGAALVARGRHARAAAAVNEHEQADDSGIARLERYTFHGALQRRRCESDRWCAQDATFGVFAGPDRPGPTPFQSYCDQHIDGGYTAIASAHSNWAIEVRPLSLIEGITTAETNAETGA